MECISFDDSLRFTIKETLRVACPEPNLRYSMQSVAVYSLAIALPFVAGRSRNLRHLLRFTPRTVWVEIDALNDQCGTDKAERWFEPSPPSQKGRLSMAEWVTRGASLQAGKVADCDLSVLPS